MSEKTITQQAYDKAVEAMGAAGTALKGQYENVKGYIDINDDGSITFKDTEIAGSTLADNVKAGLGTLKAGLSDKASQVYKAAFGDGQEEGLWGAFTKNPINMVMAGVGALLAGLLFAESGIIGLIIAAVVGALAFGGLSTYLNQPHEDPHAAPTPGANQPAAGTQPAVAQGVGLNVELADGKDAASVLSDGKIEAGELKDGSKLPAGKVLLTEHKDPNNLGAVILATETKGSNGGVTYTDIEVALPDGKHVKLQGPLAFDPTVSTEDIKKAIIGSAQSSGQDVGKDAVAVDDFVKPLATPAATAPTGPAAGPTPG